MARAFVAMLFTLGLSLTMPLAVHADDIEPTVAGKSMADWLQILQGDKDVQKRKAALIAAEILTSRKDSVRSRKLVPAVAAALKQDESADVRVAAARLLGKLAEKAAESQKDPKGRFAEASREDFKQALGALTEAVRSDKEAKVRTVAATAVGRIGPDAEATVPTLTAALRDRDDSPRAAAAEALGRIGKAATEAAPALLEALQDKKADRFVRIYSAFALARVGGATEDRIPVLATILSDKSAHYELRKAAAEALGQMGAMTPEAIVALTECLKEKQWVELRRTAIAALDLIGPGAKTALPDLKMVLKDEDKYVRSSTLHLIGRLGEDGADAVPDVISRMKEDSVLEVRLAAIETLGLLGANMKDPKDILNALDVASTSSQTAVRNAAKDAIKKIKPEPEP